MTTTILFALTLRQGPWYIRLQGRHVFEGQRHIHVSRNGLRDEYSWNLDGMRHDEHRFPSSEQHIGAAKRVAAEHLGVSPSILRCLAFERLESPLFLNVSSSSNGQVPGDRDIFHYFFSPGSTTSSASLFLSAFGAPSHPDCVLVVTTDEEV